VASTLRLSQVRLNRAQDYLRDFRRVEAAFLAQEPYRITLKYDAKAREYVLWFHVRKPPPIELSVILSDCVHQMRSTLDNAVCAIADNGGSADRLTAMPVCPELGDWTKPGTKRRLAKVPEAAHSAIESLQPYKRGDRLLFLLDELSSRDKHRGLVYALVGTTLSLPLDFNRPVYLSHVWLGGFDQSGPICRVTPRDWTIRHPGSDLHYNRKPSFRVGFGGFGTSGAYINGLVVATNLHRLYKFVRYEAIPTLKPFF
jgi:hypothetical protein